MNFCVTENRFDWIPKSFISDALRFWYSHLVLMYLLISSKRIELETWGWTEKKAFYLSMMKLSIPWEIFEIPMGQVMKIVDVSKGCLVPWAFSVQIATLKMRLASVISLPFLFD